MAGFMIALGGALKGAGGGLEKGIAARRQEQLDKLANDRADARSEREMQFRSTEAAAARSFDAGENEKSRAAQGNTLQTDSEGNTVSVNAGTGKSISVVTPEGKPLKLLPKASDTPGEVSTAKWLMETGVAKNANEAWNLVRRSRSDPEKSKASIYKAIVTSLGASGMDPDLIPDEAQKQTEKAWAFLSEGDDDAAAAPAPDTDRSSPGKATKVTPMKPGELRAPPGDGSAQRPFKAAKQQDIDWFKKFAQPGQKIVGPNGDIYTK